MERVTRTQHWKPTGEEREVTDSFVAYFQWYFCAPSMAKDVSLVDSKEGEIRIRAKTPFSETGLTGLSRY